MTAQREIRLITAAVVAAEGICPDEVLRVLHAQPLRAVVGVGHHVLAAQSIASAHAVGGHPPLELHVLEVIRTLVAVLVLHPRDGALAGLRHLFDTAGGAYHLRFFGVELLGVAVVADNLLTLGHGLHQCVVAPILDVHTEALQQLVGVARERDVTDDPERVAVVLFGDVGARLFRPLHVVEPILQFPCLQPGVLEVRVAIMLHGPCLLVQRIGRISTHKDVERVACTACVGDGGPVDGRHVVRNPVILTGDEVPGILNRFQLAILHELRLNLWSHALTRSQLIHCYNSHIVILFGDCLISFSLCSTTQNCAVAIAQQHIVAIIKSSIGNISVISAVVIQCQPHERLNQQIEAIRNDA